MNKNSEKGSTKRTVSWVLAIVALAIGIVGFILIAVLPELRTVGVIVNVSIAVVLGAMALFILRSTGNEKV